MPIMEKSCRLLDFNIYDESNEDASSGSDNDKSKNCDKKQFIIQVFGINEKGETFVYLLTTICHSFISRLMKIGILVKEMSF